MSAKADDKTLSRNLRQMVSPPLSVYRDVILASVFINIFTLCLPLITMSVYQKVLPASATATLVALCIGVLSIVFFDWAFNQFRMRRILAVQTKTDTAIARAIYRKVAGAQLDGRVLNGGVLMSTVRDFDQARSALATGVISVLVDAPFMILFILLLLFINVYIGAVTLVGVTAILIAGFFNMRNTMALHSLTGKASAARHALLLETIRDFVQTRTNGWLGSLTKQHDNLTDDLTLASAHMSRTGQSASIVSRTLVQAVQTITTLAGAWAVMNGSLSMAALIGFSMLAARTAGMAGQIAAIMPRWAMAKKSLSQVEESLNMKQERQAGQSYMQELPEGHEIAFEGVNFTYPDMPVAALSDVSFQLPAGKTLVVMGASGSGKSTLLKLVMGVFAPSGGHVRFGGVDVSYIDPDTYRGAYSGLSAEPVLFGETLAEWFSGGMPKGSLVRAQTILKSIGFGGFLQEHPRGIYRPLEAGGQGFSVGQKKIVALVRALLRPTRLLVLDEPTESMDKDMRKKIVKLIADMKKERSLIIASHDDDVLALADYIAVLGNGRILVFDTKEAVEGKLRARASGV